MEKSIELIQKTKAWEAIHYIGNLMREKKKTLSNDEWITYIHEAVRKSHLQAFCLLCPFTKRSFEKPRGYSGDAVMMDYIYGHHETIKGLELDLIAEEIFRFTTNTSAPRAVRFRRRLLARYIDETCKAHQKNARILSVACGHLREIDLSNEVISANFDRFIAIDQDQESLKVVEGCYGIFGIDTLLAPIKDLITGRAKLEKSSFDFVYSAGLYDYLASPVAEKLTLQLFDYVAPRGKLLIANFLPEVPDVGYMESLMDWWLIYRNQEEMDGLIKKIPNEQIAYKKTFTDPDENIAFLEIGKI